MSWSINTKKYLFYYRDIDQKEIDLLYVLNNAIYPIEVKKGQQPTKPTKILMYYLNMVWRLNLGWLSILMMQLGQ